jgi:hypothetical protein
MKRSKRRGSTMALYAMFLVTVGVPLLAVGVDVSRVKYAGLQLVNATQAACQAYANSLDVSAFKKNEGLKFRNGYQNAYRVFFTAMPSSASFIPVEVRKPDPARGGASIPAEKVMILCSGSAKVRAILPFFGDYSLSASATAITKFSTEIN